MELETLKSLRHGHNHIHWTQEDRAGVTKAETFGSLSEIAIRIAGRLPQPVGQVCGPISTGGRGSIEENLAAFQEVIARLVGDGKTIFDQMPFEEHIFRVADNTWGARKNNLLLEQFYLPLFQSGNISTLYFMPDWQSSHGATWEHAQAERLDIKVIYLN